MVVLAVASCVGRAAHSAAASRTLIEWPSPFESAALPSPPHSAGSVAAVDSSLIFRRDRRA